MAKTFRTLKNAPPQLQVLRHTMPTTANDPEGIICAEFETLGDAKGFPPEALDPDAKLDRVVLAIALMCNDMLDAFSVAERMRLGQSTTTTPTPYDGARAGRHGWATRVLTSITHEALHTMKTHEQLLKSAVEVQDTLSSMTQKNRSAWLYVMSLALEQPALDPRRGFFKHIRNKVSYHYAEPEVLAAGYRKFFFESEKTEFNEFAYVSGGSTYRALRFHFADAAVGAAAEAAMDIANDPANELMDVAGKVVEGLFNFVLKFMEMRVKRLHDAARR